MEEGEREKGREREKWKEGEKESLKIEARVFYKISKAQFWVLYYYMAHTS